MWQRRNIPLSSPVTILEDIQFARFRKCRESRESEISKEEQSREENGSNFILEIKKSFFAKALKRKCPSN
jgi:hypothetical protein